MVRRLHAVIVALTLSATACGGTGSGGIGSVSFGASVPDFTASAQASKHPIDGKVVAFDAKQHKITIAHEAIPDYMDAMTMEFRMKEAWPFNVMTAGDTVRGTLVVDGARSWIEGVTVAKAIDTATAPR